VGLPWRADLNNTSGRTNSEPASKGNTSTIATASKQCQTKSDEIFPAKA